MNTPPISVLVRNFVRSLESEGTGRLSEERWWNHWTKS